MNINEKTAPTSAYEFVMTQLILRAAGIKTSEMDVIINVNTKDVQTTTVDLRIKQGKLTEIVTIGTINLEVTKVNKMWAYWTEVAATETLSNFDKCKDRSQVFKCVDVLLKHLLKLGFELKDTPIIETHDTDLVH